MNESSSRIVVEMDEGTIKRLLRSKNLSMEEVHSRDSNGRQRLRSLLLDILRHELSCDVGYKLGS